MIKYNELIEETLITRKKGELLLIEKCEIEGERVERGFSIESFARKKLLSFMKLNLSNKRNVLYDRSKTNKPIGRKHRKTNAFLMTYNLIPALYKAACCTKKT